MLSEYLNFGTVNNKNTIENINNNENNKNPYISPNYKGKNPKIFNKFSDIDSIASSSSVASMPASVFSANDLSVRDLQSNKKNAYISPNYKGKNPKIISSNNSTVSSSLPTMPNFANLYISPNYKGKRPMPKTHSDSGTVTSANTNKTTNTTVSRSSNQPIIIDQVLSDYVEKLIIYVKSETENKSEINFINTFYNYFTNTKINNHNALLLELSMIKKFTEIVVDVINIMSKKQTVKVNKVSVITRLQLYKLYDLEFDQLEKQKINIVLLKNDSITDAIIEISYMTKILTWSNLKYVINAYNAKKESDVHLLKYLFKAYDTMLANYYAENVGIYNSTDVND